MTLYVDGELSEADRVTFEAHLEGCRACRSATRYDLALRNQLRKKVLDAAPAPSTDLKRKVRLALDSAPAPLSPGFTFRRFLRPMPVAAAGATALGLTAYLYFGNPTEDVVRDLVARHSRRLPLEFRSNDPKALEDWLADKVNFHVRVPTLSAPHLALVGARLSDVGKHPAVYLVYRNEQRPARRVSMLVYDDPSKRPPAVGVPRRIQDREVYTANAAGFNVAVWKDNEIVYSLVSDGDDNVLDLVRAANR